MVSRIRVTLNGLLGTGGVEQWSCGVNYAAAGALTEAEAIELAADLGAALTTAWASNMPNMKTILSNAGTITDLDVYSYGPTGPAQSAANYVLPSALTGSGTITCPPQCAAVFSLRTGRPGSSGRGRIYWPALAPSVSATLRSTPARNASDDLVYLLQAWQAIIELAGGGGLGVYSPTLDVVTAVTSIRSGDVIDTQRRRRDALQETYEITAYA